MDSNKNMTQRESLIQFGVSISGLIRGQPFHMTSRGVVGNLVLLVDQCTMYQIHIQKSIVVAVVVVVVLHTNTWSGVRGGIMAASVEVLTYWSSVGASASCAS